MSRRTGLGLVAMIALGMAGCGGGGGGGGSGSSSPPTPQGTVSGTAYKGPVSGATVKAYGISGGMPAAVLGTGSTDAQGHFSVSVGSYAGPVMLQMSGGTYTDEATGGSAGMMAGDTMTAVIPSMTSGQAVSGVQMTPLTSMAQAMAQRMTGGMTDANIGTANSAVGAYFMVIDVLHTSPMDTLVQGSGNSASQDAMDYGMTIAAVCELAETYGMSSASAMVTAMMSDAMDGLMDGRTSGTPVMMSGMSGGMQMPANAGSSGLANAMQAFIASPQNHSGVAAASMQALMSQLTGSGGQMMSGGGGMGSNTMISGGAFNGAMSHGMVSAFAVSNGVRGAQLASAAMGPQGTYALSLGGYSGPVMLQISDGTYTDEATGSMTTMASGDVMTAVLPNVSAGSTATGVWITPLSSMAQLRAQSMTAGMSSANVQSANTAVGNYFMVSDLLHSRPMDPRLAGLGGSASADERDCGMVVAAMSQYAKEQGLSMPFAFVTNMMRDASDGRMDGMMGGSAIQMGGGMMGGGMMQSNAGTSGLAGAMTDFVGAVANQSGLTAADMNALIQHLASSDGQI